MTDRGVREIMGDLVELGLSAEHHVLIAELIAVASRSSLGGELPGTPRPKSPGALRQQRYRERHQASPSVTSDAPNVTSDGCNVTGDAAISPPSSFSPIPPHITTPPPQPVEKSARARGSRLPADWHPSEELWQAAKAKLGLTEETLRFETGAFRDHWRAATGGNAAKLDWGAAWRNWMREALRRGTRRTPKRDDGMSVCNEELERARTNAQRPSDSDLFARRA